MANMEKQLVCNKTKCVRAFTVALGQTLEYAASRTHSAADRYIAGHFWVLRGSSARLDDGLHRDPATIEDTAGAITCEPWQQKNLDRF